MSPSNRWVALCSASAVAGPVVARYTGDIFISNQTLMVKINNSALRAELSMMRTQLVNRLNQHVGVRVIADIKFF